MNSDLDLFIGILNALGPGIVVWVVVILVLRWVLS